jgi:hypothetical protein
MFLTIKPHETVNQWLMRCTWERLRNSRDDQTLHSLANTMERIETTRWLIRRSDSLIHDLWREESRAAVALPALPCYPRGS